MDEGTAYEALSRALWRYVKEHDEAYVRLMLAVRDVENTLGKPPIPWPGKGETEE